MSSIANQIAKFHGMRITAPSLALVQTSKERTVLVCGVCRNTSIHYLYIGDRSSSVAQGVESHYFLRGVNDKEVEGRYIMLYILQDIGNSEFLA